MRNIKLILLPIFAMSLGMLTGCNDEINSAISDIQSHIDDMQSDIDDLKNQIKDLKDQIAKLEGEMSASIAQVEADYKKAIAEVEADIAVLQKNIDDLTAQLAVDKAALETDYNSKINKVRSDYDAQLATLKDNYDKQLADLEQDYKDKIDDLKEEYDAQLATITANYDAQLAALVADYNNQLDNVRNDYNTKLSNVQATYDSKVAKIEADIASANAQISALQSELALQISSIQNDYNTKINALTNRVAILEEVQTHTVTFNTNGGNEITPQIVIHGEKARKPEDPVRAGATFKGWSYHDEPWYFYSSVVTENMELVAQWELINYRATFKNDDGTVLETIENVHYGEAVTYSGETPIKPNQEDHYGYTFAGWDKELVVYGDTEFIAQYDKEYLPFQERYLDAEGNILYQRYVSEEELLTKVNYNDEDLELVDGHYRLEAEDAILSGDGVRADIANNASGGKSVGYFDVGTYVTFSFNVSQNTLANLAIGLANGGGNPLNRFVRIVLNDEDYPIGDGVRITDTHDWDTYLKFVIGEIHLKKGENTLILYTEGGINLDYLDIENFAFDLAQEGVEEPTKANEETMKFSFRQWELVSNENDVIIYRPVFDAATIGLEFLDNMVEIYHGASKEVVIPSFWNKKEINFIGESSFSTTDVKEVQLPDTIKEIGSQAFYLCERLNKINLPNNLKTIGSQAFDSTHSLENITFNEGIKNINSRAFESSGLKEVILPENIDFIGDNAFGGLYADYIYVPATTKRIDWHCFYSPEGDKPTPNIVYTNKEYRPSTWDTNWALRCEVVWGYKAEVEKDGYKFATYEADGVKGAILIGYDSSIINFEAPEEVNGYPVRRMCVSFKENKTIKSVILPSFIETINNDMFLECTYLEYIYIPDSVKTIGERAFRECSNLKTIRFSNSLESIGIDAFMKCTRLTTVTFPESLQTIERYAFSDCERLGDIIIPDSVTELGQNAFSNCDSMTSITFPKNMEEIRSGMCENCENLTNVVFPENVKIIRGYAFFNCASYVRPLLKKSLEKIEAEAFGYDWGIDKTFYEGTQEEFELIDIGSNGNNCILDKPIYYYSDSEPATPGNFWRYVEGVPTIW